MSTEKKSNAGRPPFFENESELIDRIQEYFDKEKAEGSKFTITGLAYHLGFTSRQSIYDYEIKDEFSFILKRARLFIENSYEKQLHGPSPAGSIFALKNFGWSDKQEVAHSGSMGVIWNEEKTYEKPDTSNEADV